MEYRNGLSDEDLVCGMDELHIDVGVRQRRFLSFLAEFDKRQRWKRNGHRDAAEWVCARYGYSRYKARRCVAAAHVIDSLPLISQALCDGQLNLDRVIELTRMATPETEAKLIPWARRVTAWWIGQQANLNDAKASRRAKRAHSSRCLQWWWDEDSMLSVSASLTTDQGAAFIKAIDRVVDTTPESPAGERDPIAARRADALCALVSQRLADDPDLDRATVILHTTPEKLTGKHDCSELEGGVAVSPRTAQRIACDSRIQTVVHDDDGSVIEITETAYQVPPHLRRVVLQRDNYMCTFPGCECRRVDIHHMTPYPEGPTEEWNLACDCRVHHPLVHEHGWKQRSVDGVVKWFMPDGRLYDPKPSAARPRAPDSPRAGPHQKTDP